MVLLLGAKGRRLGHRMECVLVEAQMPSIFLTRLTSAFSSSTMPALRRCFLRLPVVGADANAAPDLRPACRRRILPEPVTLKRLLVPEWVLFFGMTASTSLCVDRVCWGVGLAEAVVATPSLPARSSPSLRSGLDLRIKVLGATALLLLCHRTGRVRCLALRVFLGLAVRACLRLGGASRVGV